MTTSSQKRATREQLQRQLAQIRAKRSVQQPPASTSKNVVSTFIDDLKSTLFKHANKGASQLESGLSSSPFGALQAGANLAGTVAGGAADLVFGTPLRTVFHSLPQRTQESIKGGVGATANALGVPKVIGAYEDFKTKNPRIAQNVENVANIAALIPGARVAGEALSTAGKKTFTTLEDVGAGIVKQAKGLGLTKDALPRWSKALEEVNLRLTPVQRRTMKTKIDDVTEYLSKNNFVGTAEKRLEMIEEKYRQMEPELEDFLSNTAKGVATPKKSLISDLETLKTKYQNRVDTDAIEGQIDRVIKTIELKQPDLVPLTAQNSLKRSAYNSAYNEAGNKVLDDVMHDVGDVFKSNIEKSTVGMRIGTRNIAEFNREYGTLINARKLLRIAASRKDIGFTSKILSSLVAGGIGSSIGGAVGMAAGAAVGPKIAEMIAGTATRSAISSGLRKIYGK